MELDANFWVASSLGLISIIFTGVSFIREKIQLRVNIFSELLEEVADEKARRDRRLIIRQITNKKRESDMTFFNTIIESVRNEQKDDNAELGHAVERTIARFDRVGFFLLGRSNKPITHTSIWLYDQALLMWNSLSEWIKQSRKNDASRQNYACYFEKLADYAKNRIKKAQK